MTDEFTPWDDEIERNDPWAPRNDLVRRDDPFEPWNDPLGSERDLPEADRAYYDSYDRS